MNDMRVVLEELLLPFFEILWQFIIIFIGYHIFLNPFITLDFLKNRCRVGIYHIKNHPSLSPIASKGLKVFVQISNKNILAIFQL